MTPSVDSTSFHDFEQTLAHFRTKTQYIILGCQGSGTNLVSRLLTRLFAFSVVHDRSLIYNTALALGPKPTPRQVQHKLWYVHRHLFPGPIAKRLQLKHYYHQGPRYANIEHFFDVCKLTSAADFANFFYSYHAWLMDARNKAIKSDDIWQTIDKLDCVFPNPKVFLVVRDPRDIALSICNKTFGPCNPYVAARYVRQRVDIYRNEAQKRPDDTLIVRYETLLAEPERVVQEIQSRFGLEPVNNWSHKLQQLRIRSNNVDKWRRLSTPMLAACEAVLADSLQEFDYAMCGRTRQDGTAARVALWRIEDVRRRLSQKCLAVGMNIIRP